MVGQNIGKYRVLDRVGRGGMGTVYRAIDETLHREVAIKVLNAELNDPTVARRFRAEAVTVARLNHPGIATVYELFQNDGQWLMVMEFLRGETLEHLIADRGPLSVEKAADLCMQALAALAHAHSLGVVHRDLKPANLMVNEAGVVKVMDFGIARVAGTEHLTSVGFMMGTPAYMAPEQVRGEDIDARTDLFAMGVVLFFLTTGKLPFRGDTPIEMAQSRMHDDATPLRSMRTDLPEWFGQVVDRALARQPDRRFQSAPGFRDALHRGLANLPLDLAPQPAVPADLIATAAPGALAVPAVFAPPVRAAEDAEPMPTVASSIDSPPVPASARGPELPAPPPLASSTASLSTPSPSSEPRPAAGRSTLVVAAAVAAMVALGGGGWWWAHRSPATSPAASDQPQVAAGPAPASPSSAAEPNSSAPAGTTASSDLPIVEIPPPPPGTSPAGPTAGGAAAPAAGAGAAAASAPRPAGEAGVSSAAPARAGGGPAGTPAPRGRGVAGTSADTHLAFGDIRMLTFSGKKADEQPAIINFVNGQMTVVSPRAGTTLATMPYADLTYAVYIHAKDPKWSVVLSAPPPDPDLPGGLFRSARHWLTLQSRSAFMILRLNDGDWRTILQAVSARTGVQVERPAAPR